MSVKVKPAGKLLIIAAVITVGILGVKWYQNRPKEAGKAVEVGKVLLPDAPEASLKGDAVLLPLPSDARQRVDFFLRFPQKILNKGERKIPLRLDGKTSQQNLEVTLVGPGA